MAAILSWPQCVNFNNENDNVNNETLSAGTFENFKMSCAGNKQKPKIAWWRHQMETSSALLALCEGNSPITVGFPSQRPVTQSFYVDLRLNKNKRFSKSLRRWWFETPSRSLWRYSNEEFPYSKIWLSSISSISPVYKLIANILLFSISLVDGCQSWLIITATEIVRVSSSTALKQPVLLKTCHNKLLLILCGS